MQRFKYKLITVLLCIALVTVLLTGCGGGSLPKPARIDGVPTYEVTGTCQLEIKDGIITVSGQTDLMNGVILNVSVHAQSGEELDKYTFSKTEDQISHDFTITADKYDDSVQAIIGYITCAPSVYGKQSEGIIKTYGENFEYIDVPDENYIWSNDGIVILFASEMLEF